MIPLMVLGPLCSLCCGRMPDTSTESPRTTCPKDPQIADCGALALYNDEVSGAEDGLLAALGEDEFSPALAMRYMGRPIDGGPEDQS